MHRNVAIRRLWWKESRQLLPLIYMLVGLTIVMYAMLVFSDKSVQAVAGLSLFVGLPGLYAVGAGALLVGQEKDQKTLNWLNTLPIPPLDLMRAKLFTSLFALVLLWIVSLGLAYLHTGGLLLQARETLAIEQEVFLWRAVSWPLHTLYLLLAGFAIAWRWKSSFVGLLALVPISFLPTLVAAVVSQFASAPANSVDWWYRPHDSILIVMQIIGCSVAFFLAHRNSLLTLGPTAASRKIQTKTVGARLTRSYGRPRSAFSALCWQWFAQNKLFLFASFGIVLLILAIESASPMSPVSAVLGWLAISWLGASAFQSDKMQNRSRFLADRGVSPWQVWLSRHVWPLGLLCLCAIPIVFVAWRGAAGSGVSPSSAMGVPFLFLAFCLVAYISAQWASYLVNSPIVAAIAGPASAVLGWGFVGGSNQTLGTPVWLLTPCVVIPMLCTCLTMSRWMDCRRESGFWLLHGSGLAAIVLIAAFPFLTVHFTYPPMTRATEHAITTEAERWSGYTRKSRVELYLPDEKEFQTHAGSTSSLAVVRTSDAEDIVSVPFATPKDMLDRTITVLQHQLEDSGDKPISASRVESFLCAYLVLTRMQAVEPTNEGAQASRETYDKLYSLISQIVVRCRLSPKLIDQDSADRLEIVLLRELVSYDARAILQSETDEEAIRHLADRKSRNEARRRALALSYRGSSLRNSDFTGYNIQMPSSSTSVLSQVKNSRLFSRQFIEPLWQLAVSSDGNTEVARQSLVAFLRCNEGLYGLGTSGKYLRADDLNEYISPNLSIWDAPGTQWHADWERQAELLATSELKTE